MCGAPLTVAVFVFLAMQVGCAFTVGGPIRVSPEQRAAYDAAMGNLPANPAAAGAIRQSLTANTV